MMQREGLIIKRNLNFKIIKIHTCRAVSTNETAMTASSLVTQSCIMSLACAAIIYIYIHIYIYMRERERKKEKNFKTEYNFKF